MLLEVPYMLLPLSRLLLLLFRYDTPAPGVDSQGLAFGRAGERSAVVPPTRAGRSHGLGGAPGAEVEEVVVARERSQGFGGGAVAILSCTEKHRNI